MDNRLHGGALASGIARRCRHSPCRSGARNAAASRLGDVVCERHSLSGKSAGYVLERRGELYLFRHQRMEYAFSADADRSGDDSLDLRPGTLGVRRRRWIRFRTGAGNRARPISFYALFDSRRSGRTLAHADVLAFSGFARANKRANKRADKRASQSPALDLLEPRRSLRAQRAD